MPGSPGIVSLVADGEDAHGVGDSKAIMVEGLPELADPRLAHALHALLGVVLAVDESASCDPAAARAALHSARPATDLDCCESA